MHTPVFFARSRGGVEYICPHCLRFQKTQVIDWRQPRRQCTNKACTRTIAFGILARNSPAFPNYENARFMPHAENLRYLNRIGAVGESVAAVGQFVGTLEWWCPRCTGRNIGPADPHMGYAFCKSCRDAIYLSLILYIPLAGAHAEAPADWVPPLEEQRDIFRDGGVGTGTGAHSGSNRGAQSVVSADSQAADERGTGGAGGEPRAGGELVQRPE